MKFEAEMSKDLARQFIDSLRKRINDLSFPQILNQNLNNFDIHYKNKYGMS